MNPSTDLKQDIDNFVNNAMQIWNVPGLAVVIVKDDQILLTKKGLRYP